MAIELAIPFVDIG